MKKFFKNTLEVQAIPNEMLCKLFTPEIEKALLENKRSNRFVLAKEIVSPDGYIFQVFIQDIVTINNTYYCIIVFDKDENYLGNELIKSLNEFPPVHEKIADGLDYFDYLAIQDKINDILVKRLKAAPIVKDTDPKGKMVYTTPDTELAKKLISEGKQYSVVGIFAEKFLEQVKLIKT